MQGTAPKLPICGSAQEDDGMRVYETIMTTYKEDMQHSIPKEIEEVLFFPNIQRQKGETFVVSSEHSPNMDYN